MHILVTGTAGFIDLHLTRRFLEQGDTVVGLDNLNDYYEVSLKRNRLLLLEQEKGFEFSEADLSDSDSIREVFDQHTFDRVVNLAAQAEVRYSLENPKAYIDTNIVGFLNILENCRHVEVSHLLYASNSSAYGANTKMSLSVHHNVDHPVNLYAARKNLMN
jgi:UDP-glucuronate 4-epimerase